VVESEVAALGLGDSVVLLGRRSQPEVAAIVRASDVLVAPYPVQQDDFLGTPLKLVEYLAAGKAIVASQARLHDLIADGVTGLRVPPADPHALAAAILQLLGDPDLRATLGAAAARDALRHSWDRVVEELEGILFAAVADRRRLHAGS
jgi:glycosyltransferase involved in cell wall biosynthesis